MERFSDVWSRCFNEIPGQATLNKAFIDEISHISYKLLESILITEMESRGLLVVISAHQRFFHFTSHDNLLHSS